VSNEALPAMKARKTLIHFLLIPPTRQASVVQKKSCELPGEIEYNDEISREYNESAGLPCWAMHLLI
jgi:hypothetical protein